jgi:DsbE subfamily thiol:disulfide oxidoreductase
MTPASFLKRTFIMLAALLLLTAATIAAALMRNGPLRRDFASQDTVIHEVPVRDPALKDRGPIMPFAIDGLSDADLKGETRLVVLFASWCAPCAKEQPVLLELSKSVPVYGIDVTDKPENLDAYLKRMGNPFAKVGHDDSGDVSVSWGADGLPTSFIVSAQGHIVWRHDGPLNMEEAQNVVIPLMKRAR